VRCGSQDAMHPGLPGDRHTIPLKVGIDFPQVVGGAEAGISQHFVCFLFVLTLCAK